MWCRGAHAQGTVTGYETEYRTSKGKTTSTTFLVVGFNDKEGHYTEFKSHTNINNTSHSKGSVVDVIYVPSNPKEARIEEFGDLWAIPIFTTIFGSIWAGLFVWCIWLEATKETRIEKRGRRIQAALAKRAEAEAAREEVSVR